MPERFPEGYRLFAGDMKEDRRGRLAAYRDRVLAGDARAMGIWSLYEELVTTPARREESLAEMRALAKGEGEEPVLDPELRATAIMQVLIFPDLQDNHRLLDRAKLAAIRAPITVVQGADDDWRGVDSVDDHRMDVRVQIQPSSSRTTNEGRLLASVSGSWACSRSRGRRVLVGLCLSDARPLRLAR